MPKTSVWRIRDQGTFRKLRRYGRRLSRGPVAVTFVLGGEDQHPRVAYAIGKKVGTAVVRNRLRRRLRASVAEMAAGIPPGAYLVSVKAEAAALTAQELRSVMSDIVKAVGQSRRSSP